MNARASFTHGFISVLALLATAQSALSEDAECFWQLNPNRGVRAMTGISTDVKLEGTARGGELVLLEMGNPNPRYVRVDTQPGETADRVLARLASACVEDRPFNPDQVWHIRAQGNLLKSFPGDPGSYIFAGTETGLGIPPPPTSLSVSYDPQSQEVSLTWENPEEPYEAIKVNYGGVKPGATTSLVTKLPPSPRPTPRNARERFNDRRDKALRRFYVVGCRNGVISNAAVITWDYDDSSQQELDVQPFTGGISPNWKAWSHSGEPGALILEQGTKGEWKRVDQEPTRVLKPEEKRFFQLIKTRSPTVSGGVYRKFLGLQPGHTYRLSTRMSTLQMGATQGDWSFSFHAVPHGKKVTLTPEQMSGLAALPDGTTGPTAGCVAIYGPDEATDGKLVEVATSKPDTGSLMADITLPADADTLTVWFRCAGAISTGVGFDWIKLRDVTPQ